MEIPIREFEQVIDETILGRGLSYFKKGYVSSIEEIAPGEYEAIVEGSEEYTVKLQIENGIITGYACTCPYDSGPVCKHITAVIFYLQKEELDMEPAPRKKNAKAKTPSKPKRKTVTEQVYNILEELSHDDLKQYIVEECKGNSSFRQTFLTGFAYLTQSESKELYKKQITALLNKAGGWQGYIDWQGTRQVSRAVHDMLVIAQNHFARGNYMSAIFICCAVMEEMTDALQMMDDSNGDISGPIEVAYNILRDIAAANLPDAIRQHMFDYGLDAYNKNIYGGWDWHTYMLELATELISNEDEANKIIALTDRRQDSEFETEEVQEIKLQVLLKIKGEGEADKFIAQNLANPGLRRYAIEKNIKQKNYEEANVIALEGVKLDKKTKPGLANEWYNWLLKIAVAKKNTPKIIEYARLLFLESNAEKEPYYQLMKTQVEANLWNAFVEGLIADITKQNDYYSFDLVADIYINEKKWDRLLKLLTLNLSLHHIKQYEKYLSRDYAGELANLYESGIIDYMKNSTGRGDYQQACQYMRRMIKLGARKRVSELIEKFRREYPQRRALLDELNGV